MTFNNIINHLKLWCENKAESYQEVRGGITYVGYLIAYELEFKILTLIDKMLKDYKLSKFRMWRGNMANLITYCRILCSIILMFFHMPSTFFFILYMICGLSDVLDGIVARKTNTASNLGARLDTIADFIFAMVLLIKILSGIDIPMWLWIWIIIVAGIKIANIIVGFACTKKLIVEHTLLNKITGVLFFLLPLTLFWVDFKYSAMAVCAVATFSAIQEGYYIRKGREIV